MRRFTVDVYIKQSLYVIQAIFRSKFPGRKTTSSYIQVNAIGKQNRTYIKQVLTWYITRCYLAKSAKVLNKRSSLQNTELELKAPKKSLMFYSNQKPGTPAEIEVKIPHIGLYIASQNNPPDLKIWYCCH